MQKQVAKIWKDRKKNGGYYKNGLKRLKVWMEADYIYNQLFNSQTFNNEVK